jgi:hypothetical protein
LAEALRCAGVRLRWAVLRLRLVEPVRLVEPLRPVEPVRLVERLRVVFERVPVELLRVRLVLLRRVLPVLLVRRVPLVLFWVAMVLAIPPPRPVAVAYNDISSKELRESVATNKRS